MLIYIIFFFVKSTGSFFKKKSKKKCSLEGKLLFLDLTLEIPVYEPLFRGSARFADVRNVTLGKKKFRVPKPQEW